MFWVFRIEHVSNASYEVGSSWVRRNLPCLRLALVILRLHPSKSIQRVLLWYAHDEDRRRLGNGFRNYMRDIHMLTIDDAIQIFCVEIGVSSDGLPAK